jgi:hypothetical protein
MENVERISFLFYLNWKDQIKELNDKELRRFINNLIKYHENEEIELVTKADRMAWNAVIIGLQINEKKYVDKVEANRANGLLGGAPNGNQNARKNKTTQSTQTTQNNPNNLIIDKREEINENREMVIDKREELKENGKVGSENWEESSENRELVNDDVKIEDVFSDAELTLSSLSKETPVDIVKQSGGITLAEYYRRKNKI